MSSLFESNYEIEAEYDEDQGGRIISRYITAEMVIDFFNYFGVDKMFMLSEVAKEVIFLNAKQME